MDEAGEIAARHSDPRMTTRHDRVRPNLDRHASYIVVGFIEGSVWKQRRPQVVDTSRWLNLRTWLSVPSLDLTDW